MAQACGMPQPSLPVRCARMGRISSRAAVMKDRAPGVSVRFLERTIPRGNPLERSTAQYGRCEGGLRASRIMHAAMKRLSLTGKLFLAVLATITVVVVALGAAAHWNFERLFIGYLNEQAIARMEAALPRVRQAYAQHGNWDFVRGRPAVWFEMLGAGMPRPGDDPPSAQALALMGTDLLGAGRRVSLLDEQRQYVMGFPQIVAGTQQREIVVDGRSVGWLAIAPVNALTDAAALRFLRGQLDAALVTGALALLLAALIAWWVARTLLAPVRRVAAATHELAAGRYDTRVPQQGHDEVAQLAQDFNQLAGALQRNEQMRRDYMADVSHELRTPLAVLRGELEAMEDGVHPATPEALRLLQSEVATLSQLVHDLHELALADAGALSYRKIDLDFGALLADEVALQRRGAVQRGLRLDLDAPAAPVMLLADELRMRQLLHNVLGNALRYTDPGGQVRVRLHAADGHALLDVMDSEPGVPDELLARLLDRFFRVEGSRGRTGGGSGLGLAICRNIVLAHGGSIEARHSPLGGVWIALRLPLLSRS